MPLGVVRRGPPWYLRMEEVGVEEEALCSWLWVNADELEANMKQSNKVFCNMVAMYSLRLTNIGV